MKYVKWFVFSFLYMVIINLVSRDLGLVSTEYTIQQISTEGDTGLLDKLWYAFNIFIDNLGSMLQILGLNTEMPYILNLFFISPIVVGTGIGIVVLIRGN